MENVALNATTAPAVIQSVPNSIRRDLAGACNLLGRRSHIVKLTGESRIRALGEALAQTSERLAPYFWPWVMAMRAEPTVEPVGLCVL